MLELLKEEMKLLGTFRQDNIDVPLCACIEGKMGKAWVDKKENSSIAIVVVADFCYLLGRITSSNNKYKVYEVLEECKGKILLTDDSSWVSTIEELYPDSLKRFYRYSIKKEVDVFNKSKLESYIGSISFEFSIKRFDESLYYKALEDKFMADCCSNYSSLEDFLRNGMGYAIVHNGEIVSAASSYSYCEGSIEVTIGTKYEYRRKGLAMAAASELILDCMERNIYPRWDAANLESVALAEKLGYHFDKEYEVYSISDK